jgi:SAM-dependent methyltransferase
VVATEESLAELVDACTWPSEAFWRWFELDALRRLEFEQPILELGCGDGAFTALLGVRVDEGIDLNPRAVERAGKRHDLYNRARCLDIRSLEGNEPEGEFATIFTNSVLEHVRGVTGVLRACHGLLRPGGRLVATMPLVDMNRHLLLHSKRYAEFRRRQLQHHNLWSAHEWRSALLGAGFADVEVVPYLSGAACRSWDRLDAIGAVGVGRYRVATALGKLASLATPPAAKERLKQRITTGLSRRLPASPTGDVADPCCGLFVAEKCSDV